jgi:hypothetical protein
MQKIQGNALFMVIVVAMIIGIFCSALISVSFAYKVHAQREYRSQRLELNSVSGVNLVLAEYDVLPYNEDRRMDLYGLGHDSVRIKKNRWGLFDIGISEAFGDRATSTKIFLMGSKPAGLSKAAIYLVDDGNSLAVSGKTVINGTCFLPERGARSAEISGFHFSGNKYVNGAIKRSSRDLPAIQKEPIDSIISLFDLTLAVGQPGMVDPEQITDSVFQSFSSTPLVIYKEAPLTLDKRYSGQIIFKSDTLITVEKEASLEDVILIAPDIIIKNGFKGSLQAFATDTLAVGEDCVLNYPSALGIFKKDFSEDQPTIMIGKGAIVSGFVFSYRRVEDMRKTLISLQPTGKIIGYIYADGFLELKGDVLGGIMCNRFILNTRSSLYENHLLNVTIDNVQGSPYYLMPSLVETEKKKSIAKWLR